MHRAVETIAHVRVIFLAASLRSAIHSEFTLLLSLIFRADTAKADN